MLAALLQSSSCMQTAKSDIILHRLLVCKTIGSQLASHTCKLGVDWSTWLDEQSKLPWCVCCAQALQNQVGRCKTTGWTACASRVQVWNGLVWLAHFCCRPRTRAPWHLTLPSEACQLLQVILKQIFCYHACTKGLGGGVETCLLWATSFLVQYKWFRLAHKIELVGHIGLLL